MTIEIKNIFWDSQDGLEHWIDWFEKNLIPFPVQMSFILNPENLLSVLLTKLSPFNPVVIYGMFSNGVMIGSFILTTDIEDESIELTHFVLDSKIQKTYVSGIALIEVGKFLSNYMQKFNIAYFHTTIPFDSSALQKILIKFGAEQKGIFKSYQKIRTDNNTFRRDVIYFEKVFNLNK